MSETREYIKDKNIEVLFEKLMRLVISKKPESPIHFLISILQDKGDSLLDRTNKGEISSDGPSKHRHCDKSLSCDGQAIDIRKSFERVLPRSFDPKPTLLSEKEQIGSPQQAVLEVTMPNTKAVPSNEEKLAGNDIQNVQSILNFGRKTKSPAVSLETGSAGEDTSNSCKNDVESNDSKKGSSDYESGGKMKNEDTKGGSDRENEHGQNNLDIPEDEVCYDSPTVSEILSGLSEPASENNVLITASCDLTELASWTDGVLEIESLDCGDEEDKTVHTGGQKTEDRTVEQNSVMRVQSGAPPPTILTKQSEDIILREEVFNSVKTALGTNPRDSRGSSPCKTVFFDECDGDIPVIQQPNQLVAVFQIPQDKLPRLQDNLTRLQTQRDTVLSHNHSGNGDDFSISELSGSPWTYAESFK